MTLYNPFFKFLSPRNSGLITFKGGGGGASVEEVQTVVDNSVGTASESGTVTGNTVGFTTPVITNTAADGTVTTTGGEEMTAGGKTVDVTGTVKGDTEQLIGGQSTTQDLINQRFDNFGGGGSTTNIVNEIDTSDLAKLDQVNQGFATSAANQETLKSNTGQIMTDTGQIMSDTGQILSDVGQVRADTQGLGTKVDEGFATTAQTLGDVGTSISDLSTSNQTNFDNINTAVDTGFTETQDQVATGFADAQTNRDLLSSNILGGQGQLKDYLSDMSGRADVYYQGLAGGQENLTNNLSGLQTNFTDFRDTYDVNTNLANQSRGELQDTVSGGFTNMRTDMGRNFDAAQRDSQNVQAAVDQGNQQAVQGQRAMTRDFTKNVTDLASGMAAPDQQGAAEQNDVINRIDAVRSILASQGDNIDAGLRDQYTKLANSFDANGQLIRESVDRSGLTTRRQMDRQSNIMLAQFDQRNNLAGQSMINVNALLQQMDALGYSGQAASGDRAPQQLVNRRAAVESGMMAREQPFFSTFG
jgi:hypothetical protein